MSVLLCFSGEHVMDMQNGRSKMKTGLKRLLGICGSLLLFSLRCYIQRLLHLSPTIFFCPPHRDLPSISMLQPHRNDKGRLGCI